MAHNSGGVNVAAAHVGNATKGAIAFAALNGGPNARVLFIKKTVKSNVFTLFANRHQMTGGSSTNVFGTTKNSWKISRVGDYVVNTWMRFVLSSVTRSAALNVTGSTEYLRWTHNLAHNLIRNYDLSFTQVTANTFDNFFLDFFAAFSVPGGKRNAYDNMIGNVPELVNPAVIIGAAQTSAQVLPSAVLYLPIPEPYTRDVGVALPSGALIYNEVEMIVDFRDWTDLLVVSNGSGLPSTPTAIPGNCSRAALITDVVSAPTVSAELWSTYALVTTDERKRMGKVPRDIVWEIVQTMQDTSVLAGSTNVEVPLRYSNEVKGLFFAIQNTTVKSDMSNYTSREPLSRSNAATGGSLTLLEFPSPGAFDAIGSVTLLYEGVTVVGDNMPIDFFSLIQPFYFGRAIPTVTGYHMYSYSLDLVSTDSLGSVDYGKLTNVCLRLVLSNDAQSALAGTIPSPLPFWDEYGAASPLPAPYGYLVTPAPARVTINMNQGGNGVDSQAQKFQAKNCSLAHTIVRSIGGAMGFPVF